MKTTVENSFTIIVWALAIFAIEIGAQELVEVQPGAEIDESIEEVIIAKRIKPSAPIVQQTTVDFADLGLRDDYDEHDRISIRLFDDARLTAKITNMAVGDNEQVDIVARFPDDPMGMFLLSYWEDGAIATIQRKGRMFDISPVGDGKLRVTEYRQGRFPSERLLDRSETEVEESEQESSNSQWDERTISHDTDQSPPVVRILMLVPESAGIYECDFVSLTRVEGHLAGQIDEVWNGAARSRVIARCIDYEPQGHKLVDYVNSGKCWQKYEADNEGETLDTDYDWLVRDANTKRLRDQLRADLVVMVIPTYQWCGVATPNGPNVSLADAKNPYAVVQVDCMNGQYSLQHELGHLLGMNHDRDGTSSSLPDQCNYGYICMRNGTASGRTVMAYYSSCRHQGGTDAGCNDRYPMYSTPDPIIHRGRQADTVCGQPCTSNSIGPEFGAANNYEQLREAARTVAQFR